jgi:hypothetical protein
VAVLAALCLGFLVKTAWYPIVEKSFRALPDDIEFREGQLQWPTNESRVLAENPFLAIAVGLDESNSISLAADIQLTFRKQTVQVRNLFGDFQFPYPPALALQSGRVHATAWWGAYNWVLLLGICACCVVALLVSWWLLATLYWPAGAAFTALFRRPSRPSQSWKLSTAALLFGAGIMSINMVLYASLMVRAPAFIAGFVLHILAGWIAIPWGAIHLPRAAKSKISNPFGKSRAIEPTEPDLDSPPPKSKRSNNPFSA